MLVGIVGKPSCGKSTFFKAATLAEADIANYPFTTIKPNHGIGYVRVECAEKEFNVRCNPRFGYCIDGKRFVPVDMIDVAGLVPGAHKGLGRGNEFLDELRQADVLIHVIDISGSVNEKGEPVDALSYDPANDIRFLETEIYMWYLGIIKKGWERFSKQIEQEKRNAVDALEKQLTGLGVDVDTIEDVIDLLNLDKEKPTKWSEENLRDLAVELRKATKPIVIAANKIDIPGAEKNLERLRKEFPEYLIVPCSAESELALKEAAKHELIEYIPGESEYKIKDKSELSEQQKKALEFVKTNILERYDSTGVQQVLDDAVFRFLKYIAVFPGGVNKLEDKDGNVLPDCFLLPPDSTALDFAYDIHSDIGDNFIKAIDVKTKMAVGKEYKLKNGDVIEIVTSK
ncbi:redox-regulated ATPase YchF [Candidatus Woesearchaeota archaeon]|nr:redox-regulated ATPase YchF [Candidatus Woesearchaeota archaeon]